MMKLEKGIISSSQLIFLIGIFIQGSIFSTTFVFDITPKDVWLALLTSFAVMALFALVYVKLMQKFPGKNLIQLNNIVFGPYLGKMVSVLYIIFFILMATANLRFLSDFIAGLFMVDTPVIIFAVMLVFACAWAVRNGVETLARISLIFLVIVSISVILIVILTASKFEFNNLLPVLNVPLMDFIQANHIILTIFFGEIFVFMMLIPYINNMKKAKKSVLLGLTIGAATMFISSVMVSGVLGNMANIAGSPIITTIRQIEVAKVLTRMDFIVVGMLIFSIFMKISVIHYAVALGIGHLFNLQSYKPVVIPIGIIFIGLVVPMHDNPVSQVESAMKTWPFFASIFEFLLPVITLLVAALRRLPKKQGG
ncbi:GerAB/ArcD/ProY family transporter [Candidatus Soleaferrea massiliensis]|uniref:GerAB/ArcD/ProY family transporter n=1 Tax=Candidatus Soleaferrea massiliensis TaxID=1470354 RepID=UPI000693E67B|nr:endospore germination permease [Candidatus Soleaferrea massiliensis]